MLFYGFTVIVLVIKKISPGYLPRQISSLITAPAPDANTAFQFDTCWFILNEIKDSLRL